MTLLGLAALQRRTRIDERARRLIGIGLASAAVCAAAAGIVIAGGPGAVAHSASAGFGAAPVRDGDLNQRVLSLSGNGRSALWTVAWQDARMHPLLGSGAGTYEGFFYEHRDTAALNVRDAHNLYLETLASSGPWAWRSLSPRSHYRSRRRCAPAATGSRPRRRAPTRRTSRTPPGTGTGSCRP